MSSRADDDQRAGRNDQHERDRPQTGDRRAGSDAGQRTVVDRVVEAGLDPRRFAADLLERLRDLVVLHEVPDAVDAGLLDAPDSQIETMRRQNEHLGLAQLSRAADLVSTAGICPRRSTPCG